MRRKRPRNWLIRSDLIAAIISLTKFSADRKTTAADRRSPFIACATALSRCVFPRPQPPWMKSGLKCAPGRPTTARAAANATWLLAPTTNVSNV